MQLKKLSALAALAATARAQNASASITDVLAGQSELSNLTSYLNIFPSLVTALGSATNITVLAPSNNAFAKFLNASMGMAPSSNLLEAILMYHVLNGSYNSTNFKSMPAFIPTLLTNSSYTNVTGGQVVEAVLEGSAPTLFSGLLINSTVGTPHDVQFSGGYVHVIDTVLTVPENISSTAVAANLTSIAGALTTANLVNAVDTTPELTVFAPSNEAFAAIGSALPNLTTDQLTSILEYHVVPGVVGYSSLLSNTSLKTLAGGNVTITVENGTVFVNSAKVLIPNVLVANGVVHVIDNVLNPNNTSATPNPTASTQVPAFSGASSVSSIPFTSGVPTPTMTVATSAAGGGASGNAGATGSASMSAAGAVKTGVVGMGALFGAVAGGAAVMGF